MNKIAKGLMGICAASLVRGARFGAVEFARASSAANWAAKPLESRALRSLPLKDLDTLLEGREVEINLRLCAKEDGMLPISDMTALLALLVAAQPSVVLEIGTFMGHTTRAIAENLSNAFVHTVDLPLDFVHARNSAADRAKDDFHLIQKREPGREFRGSSAASRIRQHFGDTATWDFSNAHGSTAFFIDGSHTYDYCVNDSEKCFTLCGGRGVFLWHDCDDNHPGVVRMLAQWRRQGREIVRVAGTPLAYWNA